MSVAYELVPATDDDFEALLKIFRSAFLDLVVRTHGPWTEEQWRHEFLDDFAPGNTKIVNVDGVAVGFVDFKDSAGGDVHLTTIAISPAHQRRGIGTQIMRDLMAHTAGVLTLQVVRDNTAKLWYERLGFTLREVTETHCKMKYP